jgi:hypothetical protein
MFPPETPAEMRALFLAIAKKLKVPLAEADLPELSDDLVLGGNEIEGILVRALRTFELASVRTPETSAKTLKEILADVLKEVRPSAHTRKLEFMDLVAVKECTDARFLPPRFRDLSPEAIEARLSELAPYV